MLMAPGRRIPPRRVGYALGALTAAWILSAAALSINQLLFHGSGIGPGPLLGVISLGVQGAMIVLVASGRPVGRLLVLFFLALAILPLQIVPRLLDVGSTLAALSLVIGCLLKATAAALLFTGDSALWFAARNYS
ncbi:MAG TPA: hypothetical protein VJO33_16895 [Gemmatimonadaceae bacterium]|nr:hypothetical protein [Gemmatimonadaceae bacterium]